jgi:hypothetical protein
VIPAQMIEPIPCGECQCGCGGEAPIAKQSLTAKGWIRGEPKRFIPGHARKKRIRYSIEDRGYETPCWIWQLAIHHENGYGIETVARKKYHAHRRAYEQANGPIPDGLEIDHLCRVRACVNPDHLEAVTKATNVRRGLSTKLTEAGANLIRSAEGTQESIAAQFGISQSQVGNIKRGASW